MSEAVRGTLSDAPASRADADVWLRDRARRVVSAHLSTREDADFARSVKSMIDKTVHEYDGRFLFELIQNGYDKQDPEKRSGLLAITLVHDELDHGVLYVANNGQGFTASNVRAIANLGLSDKEIGEGIGNKGVGFKSVLQICDSPEIYSTSPDSSPGFCFRFARSDDIQVWLTTTRCASNRSSTRCRFKASPSRQRERLNRLQRSGSKATHPSSVCRFVTTPATWSWNECRN